MPKRSYKKRRSTRKRKGFRRGARNAPVLRSIQYMKAKCVNVVSVFPDKVINLLKSYCFARYQPASLFQEQYGFNSGVRFDQCKKQWEQYMVTGMRLQWYPTSMGGRPANDLSMNQGQIVYLQTFDDIDSYNTNGYSDANIKVLDTFKQWDTSRPFTIYRNNKPLAKQMNSAWQDCSDTMIVANGLPSASVGVRLQLSAGYDGLPMGFFRTTYYVTFRGQARGQ